jgi:hypothetical protein
VRCRSQRSGRGRRRLLADRAEPSSSGLHRISVAGANFLPNFRPDDPCELSSFLRAADGVLCDRPKGGGNYRDLTSARKLVSKPSRKPKCQAIRLARHDHIFHDPRDERAADRPVMPSISGAFCARVSHRPSSNGAYQGALTLLGDDERVATGCARRWDHWRHPSTDRWGCYARVDAGRRADDAL